MILPKFRTFPPRRLRHTRAGRCEGGRREPASPRPARARVALSITIRAKDNEQPEGPDFLNRSLCHVSFPGHDPWSSACDSFRKTRLQKLENHGNLGCPVCLPERSYPSIGFSEFRRRACLPLVSSRPVVPSSNCIPSGAAAMAEVLGGIVTFHSMVPPR